MTDVVIATNEADATAASQIEAHHAELLGNLALRVEALVSATAQGADSTGARADLVAWAERELVPHALAEEGELYPAARATREGRLVVDALIAEHAVLTGLVAELRTATDAVRAAAAAKALLTMFDSHQQHENAQVLPLLVATPDVSLATLLEGMHESLTEAGQAHGHGHVAEEPAAGHGGCACGHADEPGLPELDSRTIPHAIRHATIFGALDAVKPGGGMILVANHEPRPLLGQLEQRWPGLFDVSYVERGPEVWRLQFIRG
jgi:uncharacterized protein (DUF2249 family)